MKDDERSRYDLDLELGVGLLQILCESESSYASDLQGMAVVIQF
jgi:hypothetical protein